MTDGCVVGWCGRGEGPRKFTRRPVQVCYDSPAAAAVNRSYYDDRRYEALTGDRVLELIVPKKSARTWKVMQGELCRITVCEGSQVGDLNFWNLHNTKERFYSGKTRQLHSAHLTVYDRLWSNLPYLRPMATVVADSIKYGIDEDGAGVHDVIGTRCDQYTTKLITGKETNDSCHAYLTEAVKKEGLTEDDVHDVWNIFMCTGFTKDTHQYFAKASPAKKGDYIEFIADMDLLVALSACPHGDVSIPVGREIPDSICHPLKVEVFKAKKPAA
ncbi:uncharacterized protein C11D3.03c [Schistocerca americana]|uniref:uncharacterized protein C11D3.03c n=1 Tax=Schistocerca americana TaxID=7009 RepID=UPI001F501756|nr:uncharacterized protein C11D3.03c [Schistocerca americana]XP_049785443.1 uncharacterized protein LOC126188052 [Schistocerca cancellata]XP_049785444.1 uncharacterized protein LOC126188052 [Schistocerca cancellata]XP_049813389.1 uncharacterized protein LOC126260169 [Schistocerca nitens]XP_049813390.1 uncharacterized protein LOC126260169 [Schistocerca nitens]XP_049827720.1 uncharacterized protein LOC126267002 [Schistocerca gregaria]XP_049960232.1 uncharacterized protein LOC126480884 [Schistoc